MPWTLDDIEREWLDGQRLQLPAEDVVSAFEAAEQTRGREWVLGTTTTPEGGRLSGYGPFYRVYAFGKCVQAVAGVRSADNLLDRLLHGETAAESELTAIYLLRSRRPECEIEVGPEVMVGNRLRRPDFRVRSATGTWTYVEVTQLNDSLASVRTQEVLDRIARHMMSGSQPFNLEIVLRRNPTKSEEDELARQAYEVCHADNSGGRDIADFASLIVTFGDPTVVTPSILSEDDGPRMSLALGGVGPGQPGGHVVVRAQFADQRAEDILAAEAKQLPTDQSGLVMVDVAGHMTLC